MSCWSGFWFFVSCHSVMAFPSFTIRRAGAGMLSFHFPRVSNSRWPGDASFLVLLPEQFATWSISYSECPHSLNLSWCDRSHLHFFRVPQWPTWTCTVSRQHTYFHIHTGIYICTQLQMWAKNIWRYFQMQCFCMNFCFISFLYLGKHSLSLNVKKKKRKHSMCPSYFFQSGRSTWVLW